MGNILAFLLVENNGDIGDDEGLTSNALILIPLSVSICLRWMNSTVICE